MPTARSLCPVAPEEFSHDNDEQKSSKRNLLPERTGGKGVSGSRRKHSGTALWRFYLGLHFRSLWQGSAGFHGGQYGFANLRRILPEALSASFIEAMEGFGHMIKGFDCLDAILAGIESRTSSPVRIPRDETLESAIRGLFPCGEGAGYAGGSPPRPWTASR